MSERCPKCQGLVVTGCLEETAMAVVAKVPRCVNCGWYGKELRGYYGYYKQAKTVAAGAATEWRPGRKRA